MVKSSLAAGCSITSSDGLSLFKFPSDPVLRQRWTKHAGPENPGLLEWTVEFCAYQYNFSEDCFESDSVISASMGLTKRR